MSYVNVGREGWSACGAWEPLALAYLSASSILAALGPRNRQVPRRKGCLVLECGDLVTRELLVITSSILLVGTVSRRLEKKQVYKHFRSHFGKVRKQL